MMHLTIVINEDVEFDDSPHYHIMIEFKNYYAIRSVNNKSRIHMYVKKEGIYCYTLMNWCSRYVDGLEREFDREIHSSPDSSSSYGHRPYFLLNGDKICMNFLYWLRRSKNVSCSSRFETDIIINYYEELLEMVEEATAARERGRRNESDEESYNEDDVQEWIANRENVGMEDYEDMDVSESGSLHELEN